MLPRAADAHVSPAGRARRTSRLLCVNADERTAATMGLVAIAIDAGTDGARLLTPLHAFRFEIPPPSTTRRCRRFSRLRPAPLGFAMGRLPRAGMLAVMIFADLAMRARGREFSMEPSSPARGATCEEINTEAESRRRAGCSLAVAITAASRSIAMA